MKVIFFACFLLTATVASAQTYVFDHNQCQEILTGRVVVPIAQWGKSALKLFDLHIEDSGEWSGKYFLQFSRPGANTRFMVGSTEWENIPFHTSHEDVLKAGFKYFDENMKPLAKPIDLDTLYSGAFIPFDKLMRRDGSNVVMYGKRSLVSDLSVSSDCGAKGLIAKKGTVEDDVNWDDVPNINATAMYWEFQKLSSAERKESVLLQQPMRRGSVFRPDDSGPDVLDVFE